MRKVSIIIGILFIFAILSVGSYYLTENYKKEKMMESNNAEYMAEIIDSTYITESELRYGDNLNEYDYSASTIYEFIQYLNNREYENAYSMIENEYISKNNYSKEKLVKDFSFDYEKGIYIKSCDILGNQYSVTEVELSNFEIDESVCDTIVEDVGNYYFVVYPNKRLAPITQLEANKIKKNALNASLESIIGIDDYISRESIDGINAQKINNHLVRGINTLPEIRKDIQGIIESNNKSIDEACSDYYSSNKSIITDVYGITSKTDFIIFFNNIKDMPDIISSKIYINSYVGNITECMLQLSDEYEIPVKIVKEHIKEDIQYFVFWF